MYDFSSGFGVINNAFANIGKQNELAFKQRALAELGKDINAGNYAGAAQRAIASGDASLGVSLLALGQKAQEKAAEAEWLRRNGGIADVGAAAPAGGAPLARLGQSGYTPRPTIATTEEEVQALEGSTGTPGQKVAARLVNNGLTPVAAAGVAGNLNAESRFRPTAVNPRDGRDGSDSVGMAQWNGPRAQALQQFAASQGKDWRDPNVQADFVAYELRTTEGRTGAALDQAQTPQQAGAAAIGFFRPQGYTAANPMGALGAGQRVASANQFVVGGEVAPPAVAFTPEATQVAQAPAQPGQSIADAPAPGAAQAQGFAIPGATPQQTAAISADPQVQAARQRFLQAPTERTRAIAKQDLDMAVAEARQRQADNKVMTPDQEAQKIRVARAGRAVNEAPIPPGYRAVRDAEGNLERVEPIPGSKQEREAKAIEEKKAKADVMRAETGNVVANALDDIDRLSASSSLPVAGAIGSRLASVPGFAAHDVSKALETVGANISFGQLQQMRESSPTGGALGAVTERELELLKNSYASLSQSQSTDQFKTNLGRVRATFERIVHGRSLTPTERKTGGPMTPERAQAIRSQAAEAIASGAPRSEVMKRLMQDYGIKPEGL